MRQWADFYYNMGINVTYIKADLNQEAKNPYKSATSDRFKIQNERQDILELQNLDWENADGIGAVLGFENLRAIDFDIKVDSFSIPHSRRTRIEWHNQIASYVPGFIRTILELLSLPTDYKWVSITPSGGFHVLFFADDHPFNISPSLTKAFTPNSHYYLDAKGEEALPEKGYLHDWYGCFSHLELRWNKHLVLPPSINQHNEKYRFWDVMPTSPPKVVEIINVLHMLNEICGGGESGKRNGELNTHLGGYYNNNPDFHCSDEFLEHYDYGEFLDFSPENITEYIAEGNDDEIPDTWLK